MVTVTDVQTNSGDRLSTNTTPNPGDAAESFELALTQQSQTLAQQNTVPFPSPSPGGGTVDLSPPSESANSLVDLIEKAFAGIPEGTAGIIGTRINAIPDELLKRFPQNIQDRIAGVAGTSAAVAFIFPPDSIQRLRNGGPIQGLIDVLLNTTLWLGIVPPSGPFNPSGNQNPPSLSDPFTFPGADAAYVMTARLNEGDIRRGVTVDFRAGWAYLNDIRPQNILQRQNPIVPDKADPDTWLFINAGITGSLGSVEEIPQAFTNGFEQLANGLSISSNSSGTPQFEFNAAGGGVVTAGALARIPTSERWTEALGNWLLNAGGASTATGVGAAWGAFLTALGVVFKQSTGLYVGPGWSVSRLTLDTSGELTYYSPNNRYSGNILDIPAAGTNLGASITRPINQDLATSIDNLASPTRTTLAQIIDTPTDLRDGEERANPTRLNLYWDEFLDSLPTSAPGVDLTTIADKLIAAYNNPNAAASEKANISHLWYQPDLEPARFIFENMLLEPATDKLIFPGSLNYGQDGVLGIEDLPALFDFAKQQWGNAPGDTNNYSSRLGRLARALYDAGWSELFNGNGVKDATIVPDLVNAIVAIENGVGQPAQENPLTDRVLPLYRFDPTQASNPDGVLVAIGDLDGLFTGPSDGAAPVLITPPAPSDAYRSIDESVGDLTTIAFRGQTSGFDIDFSNPDTQAALQEVEVVGLTDNDDIIRGDYTGRTVLGLGGNDTITIIDGGTVYADYSPAYVETYGPAQGLDPNNLPEGNDTIEVGDVTTGFIDAGGGNDRASINVTASVAADGTATINFPAVLAWTERQA
ncbi:MAG: hypothetical protein HC850_04025 [Rhodomicrobium sp.]|nr:hypothetical protein [Rhodomicrobium sp.]